MHTEVVSYSATQPNTGAAATVFTGDSLTMKNARGKVQLLAMWGFNQVEGFHQLIAPSMHDTTRGWRTVVEATDITPRNVIGTPMWFFPQETISVTIAGSNVAGDVETGHMLLHYEDLPGTNSRHIGWDDLTRRIEKQTTIQATVTGTAAGYSGSELVTADSDLLHANRDYAILGIETVTPCGCVTILGPDTGNVRTAVPGNSLRPDLCGSWFAMLSRAYGLPTIPVLNSGNKGSTFLSVGMNENFGATVLSVNLAMLRKRDSDVG